MPIYEKTEIGRAVITDATNPLPRKLKSLLVAIDGRTPIEQYIKNLSAFGDVESMFNSLVQTGYIRNSIPSQRPAKQTEKLMDGSFEKIKLAACITQISNFFTEYMPERAIEMLLIFEGISSLHELKKNLPGYEKMIFHLGSVAQQHIQTLRQMLDDQ